MKQQTLVEHFVEVMGGTPLQIVVKIIVGALAVLWSHLSNVSNVVMLYFILVVIDVIVGTALAAHLSMKMDRTRWFSGPAKKLGLTAALFMGASVIDNIIPGQFVLYGTSGYVAGAMFLDVAKKYDTLTGLHVLQWLQDRIGAVIGVKKSDHE
jgi:phage-related holin